MLVRKKKLKGRVMVLYLKKEKKYYVGNSASEIARRVKIETYSADQLTKIFKSMAAITLMVAAHKAEVAPDGIYENSKYLVFVTDEFIRGRSHKGNFSYR
jgi:hypothetical protein